MGALELDAVGGTVDDAAGRVAAADFGEGCFDFGRGFESVDEDVVVIPGAFRGFYVGVIAFVQQERGIEADMDGKGQGALDFGRGFAQGDGVQPLD